MGYAIVAIFGLVAGFIMGVIVCLIAEQREQTDDERWTELIADTKKRKK